MSPFPISVANDSEAISEALSVVVQSAISGLLEYSLLHPQSIIYFLIHSAKLQTWLKDATMLEALQAYTKWHHIERDPAVFSVKIDEDYVHCLQGVTRASFCNVYLEWIQYCAGKQEEVRGNLTWLQVVTWTRSQDNLT